MPNTSRLAVLLTSAGGDESWVSDGTGPSLEVLGISEGTGITLSASASAITITNSDLGSSVTFISQADTPSAVAGNVEKIYEGADQGMWKKYTKGQISWGTVLNP